MPRNGSGTYVPPAGQPVVTLTPISSTNFNTLVADLGAALTTSLATDGQSAMTGNLNFGTQKGINLGNGTLAQDATTFSQMNTAILAAQAATQVGNFLHNSHMLFAQHGTNYALTSTPTFGSLDRWAASMASGTPAGIWNQVVAPAQSGFLRMGKLGRNAGSSNTGQLAIGQACETSMSLRAAGKTVILSFYALAGANFSASGNNFTAIVRSGTGTDQTTGSLMANTWTGTQDVISQSAALTTNLVRYTFTGTVPLTATQIGVAFAYSPTGTAGADDNVYITGIKLQVAAPGQTEASELEQIDFTTDFNICKRFYQNVNFTSVGYVGAAGVNFGTTVVLPILMRVTPTNTQLINNYFFPQINVTASTSTYLSDNASVLSFRTSVGVGAIQYSEAVGFSADL
jgi:hypothetical protein